MSQPSRADIFGATSVGHKAPHFLASNTTICGSPVEPRLSSHPDQSYCNNETHGDEEIWLGLVEINLNDLTDSVCGIHQRPHVLLAFAKLDDSLPRYQYPWTGRERIYDDDNPGSLSLLSKSYIIAGRLDLLEPCLKSPENSVKGVRRNNIDRLQYKVRVYTRDKTCRFVDSVVGDAR